VDLEENTMFKLIGKVWKTGDSLVITIPKDKAIFEGLDIGSDVYAIIRKENTEE